MGQIDSELIPPGYCAWMIDAALCAIAQGRGLTHQSTL
jgi:hypothetical protein